MKKDEYIVLGAMGIGLALAYLLYQNKVGERLHFGNISVEDHIGARVPYFSRGGHYGVFGTVPTYWEQHRLTYPRQPCQNMSDLLDGTQDFCKPWMDANQAAWYYDPPSEDNF